MSSVLRELQALLFLLGITEADLAGFSEQQIDDSLRLVGIVLPAEIARVKNAWIEQRQRSAVQPPAPTGFAPTESELLRVLQSLSVSAYLASSASASYSSASPTGFFWARIAEQPFFEELALPAYRSVDSVARICQDHFKLDFPPKLLWQNKLVKVIKDNYEIDVVPLHHTLSFVFRSLTGQDSLRALVKKTAIQLNIPLDGVVWRKNALDICVQVRHYRREPLELFLAEFRSKQGISISDQSLSWNTDHHVLHSHFQIHPHDRGIDRADGKESDDAVDQVNAFSMMSDDVHLMLEPGAPVASVSSSSSSVSQ